jgi:tetratricopeptide (TPR) repeat protein
LETIYHDALEEHCERLAHHYSQTLNREKAIEYLELANRKAIKANAMQEAKTYFDQAIALLECEPDTKENRRRRILLIVNQWIVFWLLFRVPEYFELLVKHEEMATSAGNSQLLGHFQLNLGHCQWVFGLLDQAVETMMKAVSLNEAAGTVEESGPVYCMLQWSHLYLGNLEQAVFWQQPAVNRLRERFDLRWYAWSFAAASCAYTWLGRFDEAVEEARRELRITEEYRDDSLVSFAYWNLSIPYLFKSDVAKAIEYAQIASEKAPTLADKVWAQTFLGWALCRTDRARESTDLLAPLAPMYDATQFAPGQALIACALGEAYWRVGQIDDAERTLEKGLELASRTGMKFYASWMRRLLGEIALERNPEQVTEPFAAPHFEKCIAEFREIKAENELALAYASHARLHKAQGRPAEARDYLIRALEIFDRLGTLIEPDKARSELAALNSV